MRKLLILFFVIISTQVHALEDLIKRVPAQNLAAVQYLINDYSKQCLEHQDSGENRALKIDEDNLVQIKLLQGNTELTVLTASFECPGVGHIWSGSAGSPTYLIIEDMVFETNRGNPHPFDISDDKTVLINWHGGNYCETLNGEAYPNAGACFSSIYWDNYKKTFVVFGNSEKVLREVVLMDLDTR